MFWVGELWRLVVEVERVVALVLEASGPRRLLEQLLLHLRPLRLRFPPLLHRLRRLGSRCQSLIREDAGSPAFVDWIPRAGARRLSSLLSIIHAVSGT